MKIVNKEEIIKQYIKNGKTLYEATLKGNYIKVNRAADKEIEIFKYLEDNIELAYEVLPELFENENVEVRAAVATHCLALKIYEKEAESILLEIASDTKNGIFRLNAEMTLKVWKEEGKLIIYEK